MAGVYLDAFFIFWGGSLSSLVDLECLQAVLFYMLGLL